MAIEYILDSAKGPEMTANTEFYTSASPLENAARAYDLPSSQDTITDKIYSTGKRIAGGAKSLFGKYIAGNKDATKLADKMSGNADYVAEKAGEVFGDDAAGMQAQAQNALVASEGDPEKALAHMNKGRKNPFTLIELLVVIGIIAILASMLLPALSKARFKGHEIKCISQLKNHGVALIQYTDENDGMIPTQITGSATYSGVSAAFINFPVLGGQNHFQWSTQLGEQKGVLYADPLHSEATPEKVTGDLAADALTYSAYLNRETDHGFNSKFDLNPNPSSTAFFADDSDSSRSTVSHSASSTNALFVDGHAQRNSFVLHDSSDPAVNLFWDSLED